MNIFTQNSIITYYINLDKRSDRDSCVVEELKKIGITSPTRFKAIELENGALGCSMSHLKCLEKAKKQNHEYVFICEDDIQFLNPQLFITQLNKFFNDSNLKTNWDVLIVAGNNMLPYVPINDYCIQVMNCQTTTGYIVANHYYDILIQNYRDGIKKLIAEPTNNTYKIDKYWFRLQRQYNWYLLIPLSIVQREDYSDIEKKVTNFHNYMLNYNKVYNKMIK